MGKVGKFIVAAVGIGINVIPGLGQALSAAIIGLGGGTFAAVGVAQTVFSALSLAGLAAGLSLVAGIFAPGAPKPEASARQVRSPTPPRMYQDGGVRRAFGAVVLFESAADGSAIDVVAYLDGRAQSIVQVYLNDDKVTLSGGFVTALADGAFKDNSVQAGFTLGAATETAFAPVIAALPGIWTDDHRGDGVVCGYLIKKPVKSKDFLTVYPQGDNLTLTAAVQAWHRYDPRLPGQDWNDDDTWTGPDDNPILNLLRFLVIERSEDYATRILPVIDYWITAADICDSARPLKAGGTEKLYRCCILRDSTAKPAEVIAEFLKTCDGWMGENDDGHILVYAGQLYEPTVSIGDAEIMDYEVKNFVEGEDRLNEVIVTYISDQHDYNQVEASAWRDDSDIAARGVVVSTTFEPQVPSHAQSQYLAPRLAAKTNAPYSGSCSTNYSGRKIIGQRFINLTVVESGHTFFSGIAEILAVEKNQTGGASFSWVSVSETIDDWNPLFDEGDPAPVGDSVPIEPLDTPTLDSVIVSFTDNIGGNTGARLQADGTGPDRDDLTWYLRWRLDGDPSWVEQEYTDTAPGSAVSLLTTPVPLDNDIDVEIAYLIGDGRISPWSNTETVST